VVVLAWLHPETDEDEALHRSYRGLVQTGFNGLDDGGWQRTAHAGSFLSNTICVDRPKHTLPLGWRQRLQFAVVGRGIFLLLFQSWVIGSCYSFVYQTVCLLLSDLQFCVMGENKTKRLVPRVVAETQTRLLLREAAPKCADRFPSHGNICYGGQSPAERGLCCIPFYENEYIFYIYVI
jgi:hypothetical protein